MAARVTRDFGEGWYPADFTEYAVRAAEAAAQSQDAAAGSLPNRGWTLHGAADSAELNGGGGSGRRRSEERRKEIDRREDRSRPETFDRAL